MTRKEKSVDQNLVAIDVVKGLKRSLQRSSISTFVEKRHSQKSYDHSEMVVDSNHVNARTDRDTHNPYFP